MILLTLVGTLYNWRKPENEEGVGPVTAKNAQLMLRAIRIDFLTSFILFVLTEPAAPAWLNAIRIYFAVSGILNGLAIYALYPEEKNHDLENIIITLILAFLILLFTVFV